jgi:hypothetical protein
MRSWYRVVAGAAVIGAAASACQSGPARPPRVTIARLGLQATAGLIGSGTINGKPWRFRLVSSPSWEGTHQCGPTAKFAADCAAGRDYLWHGLAGGAPVYFETIGPGVYGRVLDSHVSRLSATLSDGVVLDLRPVEAYGLRWVALAVPDGLSLNQVTVYSDRSELAHAVPLRTNDGSYGFYTWLPPGDPGPARVTKAISPGLLPSARLRTGPWGNCVIEGPTYEACWSLGQPTFGVRSDSTAVPRVVLITFRPDVSYLVLFLSDGKASQVPLVRGAGIGVAAVRIVRSPTIVRWAVFDAAWTQVGGGSGPPDSP